MCGYRCSYFHVFGVLECAIYYTHITLMDPLFLYYHYPFITTYNDSFQNNALSFANFDVKTGL